MAAVPARAVANAVPEIAGDVLETPLSPYAVWQLLHGAGLLNRTRTSGGFMSYGSPGRGRWITIYANSGHVFMTIRTRSGIRRYDTSGMDDGTRWDRRSRSASGYVVRHPPGL